MLTADHSHGKRDKRQVLLFVYARLPWFVCVLCVVVVVVVDVFVVRAEDRFDSSYSLQIHHVVLISQM